MSLSNFFFGDPDEDPIFGWVKRLDGLKTKDENISRKTSNPSFLFYLHFHIFSHTMNSMRQMQNHMMNNMLTDPFRMFGMPGLGGFGMQPRAMQPFPGMNLNRLLTGGPPDGGVSYSSSSVFSVMSSGTDGRPQVYQETSSVRNGPGGVKETRRTVQDSQTGKKQMAIGHHIGERAHVIEKEQNLHTGEREEREDFINLDESDTEEFERDFQQKSRQMVTGGRPRCTIEEISSQPLLAIQSWVSLGKFAWVESFLAALMRRKAHELQLFVS